MHAFMPAILLRMTGLDAFDGDAQTQPPDGELGELEQGVGRSEGNAVVRADAARQAALLEQSLKSRKSRDSQVDSRASQRSIARGVIGDGQRVAIVFVAQPELAFVVGAPELVGLLPQRQRRALSRVAFAPSALD